MAKGVVVNVHLSKTACALAKAYLRGLRGLAWSRCITPERAMRWADVGVTKIVRMGIKVS